MFSDQFYHGDASSNGSSMKCDVKPAVDLCAPRSLGRVLTSFAVWWQFLYSWNHVLHSTWLCIIQNSNSNWVDVNNLLLSAHNHLVSSWILALYFVHNFLSWKYCHLQICGETRPGAELLFLNVAGIRFRLSLSNTWDGKDKTMSCSHTQNPHYLAETMPCKKILPLDKDEQQRTIITVKMPTFILENDGNI